MITPSPIPFSKNNIHIWHTLLTPITLKFAECASHILSVEELERLNSFLYPKDRHLYQLAHTFLRHILAKYLKQPASQIKFKVNPFGKPSLLNEEFYFNISHTKDHVIIALSQSEIGVDIEFKRPTSDLQNIADSIFTKNELELLKKNSEKDFIDKFYDLWTRKEAFVKAIGYGLSIAQDIDTSRDVKKVIYSADEKSAIWRIEELILPYPQYSASVAYLSDTRKNLPQKTYFNFECLQK